MFTKERLAELLPVMAAWVAGKTIQVKDETGKGRWIDIEIGVPTWQKDSIYRIKPEPIMIPFEAKEIRAGWIFRRTDWKPESWSRVLGVNVAGVELITEYRSWENCKIELVQFQTIFDNWLYSDDCGSTWKRCEKEQI